MLKNLIQQIKTIDKTINSINQKVESTLATIVDKSQNNNISLQKNSLIHPENTVYKATKSATCESF